MRRWPTSCDRLEMTSLRLREFVTFDHLWPYPVYWTHLKKRSVRLNLRQACSHGRVLCRGLLEGHNRTHGMKTCRGYPLATSKSRSCENDPTSGASRASELWPNR